MSQEEAGRRLSESKPATRVKSATQPVSTYKQKYEHLIGRDAGVKAADTMSTNKAYGFGKQF